MTSSNADPQVAAAAAAIGSAETAGATTSLATHAAALQTVLTDLSALTVSQLVTLFQQYQKLPNFPEILKAAFPQIVLPHANAAAMVTAQWYNELDPTTRFSATPTVKLPAQQMDKTIAWSLYAPTKQLVPADFIPREPVEVGQAVPSSVTLSRLAGSTKRMVFDASRDTVVDNTFQQGVRWARYASANACAFCRVMASKTGSSRTLYHTKASATTVVGRTPALTPADRKMRAAGLANTDELLARRYAAREVPGQPNVGAQRGNQELGEKYHDHCRCIAVPVPDGRSYEAPDYTAQWSEDYKAAVKATKAAGQTKGKYAAIDFKAVLAHMRANTDAH